MAKDCPDPVDEPLPFRRYAKECIEIFAHQQAQASITLLREREEYLHQLKNKTSDHVIENRDDIYF